MLTFYGYNKCGTCRKAKSYLDQKGIVYKDIDITEAPPSQALLKDILKQGQYSLKDLFNKSGQLYREMNMKEKMKTTSEKDLIKLLSEHGKLVKRPIATDGKKYTVGFKEDIFTKTWK